MSKPLVSDAHWTIIEPLLPPQSPMPKGGRPRAPDRACLTGIIFVLKSGIPWELLPQRMGCGNGMPSTGGGCVWTVRPSRQKSGRRDRPGPDQSRQTWHGTPLVWMLTGANWHDSTQFEARIDGIPRICTARGGRRTRPSKAYWITTLNLPCPDIPQFVILRREPKDLSASTPRS